jgi:large subunit ribosomal protein L1
MPKHGKKYQDAVKLVDADQTYQPADAIELVKKMNYVKFDPTVELHMQLGVDPRHADQMVRGTATLPAGTGKDVKVLVFAQGEKASEAENAGADFVGLDDMIKQINEGWLGFDVAVATPDVMSKVASLGRRLGPRGLMPNPKTGTVTNDVGRTVTEFKGGKVEYRTDRHGNVHVPIGKVSFPVENLVRNYGAVLDELLRAKPAAAKGRYIKGIATSSTMGPGVKISPEARVEG